jgi:hypothetical protein
MQMIVVRYEDHGDPLPALLPGLVADISLVWLWSGEPYGSFGAGGWRFALQF